MKLSRKATQYLVGGIGAVITVIAIIILSIIQVVVKNQIQQTIILTEGGHTEGIWEKPPYDVNMQFWIFDVTNVDEILLHGAAPSVVQRGPYGYTETQEKRHVMFYDNNTISYINDKTYVFNPAASCPACKESDLVTVPNVPMLTLAEKLRYQNATIKEILGVGLIALGENPFVTKSVGDLLYKGYDDILFKVAHLVKLPGLGDLPDKMGFFYGKNATDDGTYLIESGANNVDDVGRIRLWNGASTLPSNWWLTAAANMINGTDGTLYKSFISRDDILRLYVSDICRSVFVRYLEDVTEYGFNIYRFFVPPEVFDVTTPENLGFCIRTDDFYYNSSGSLDCLPSGLLNFSVCQPGNPPVIISSPHFLFTPLDVQEAVRGIHPVQEEHQTILDLEPTSGVGVAFARKLQINVAMHSDHDILPLRYLKNVIMPVLWLNESAYLNEDTKNYLWNQLIFTQRLFYGLAYTALAIGMSMVVGVVVMQLVIKYRAATVSKNSIVERRSSARSDAPNSLAPTPQTYRRERRNSDDSTPATGAQASES